MVHHGGAGTCAAGLRAGAPTIIKPFFGDQFFWGSRVQELGVGVCIRKLTVKGLAAALVQVTTDEKMKEHARVLGEAIRKEDGIQTAVNCIYRDLGFAKSRIVKLKQANMPKAVALSESLIVAPTSRSRGIFRSVQ